MGPRGRQPTTLDNDSRTASLRSAAMAEDASGRKPSWMGRRAAWLGRAGDRGRDLVEQLAAARPGIADGAFRSALKQEEQPLIADMDSDSRTLLVALGGVAMGVSMPPFEFFRMARDIPCKRLFVRDIRQAWYHMGLPGQGADFTSVAGALREQIARYDVERLVLAGASAGGYGALAFGTLLGADLVLCFAPQTVIDLDQMHELGDHRYDERLGEVGAAGAFDRGWLDLRSALPAARVADTRYHVFFAEQVRVDRLHAERLRGLAGVQLYRIGRGDHRIARTLRRSGALDRVLQSAIDVPQRPPAGLRL